MHQYIPISRTIIKVNKNDLLPGPENQTTINERYSQRGAEKRGAHMGITISIAPSGIMPIKDSLWNKALNGFL